MSMSMSSQSANMTLGSTSACSRIETAAPGTVRLLKSSAVDDDSGGPDEPELDGWLTVLSSRPLSLGVGLQIKTSHVLAPRPRCVRPWRMRRQRRARTGREPDAAEAEGEERRERCGHRRWLWPRSRSGRGRERAAVRR
ncbi:hypothetical protein ZWY2020_046811 [Hordeum vulgare]|nr:hypothetical protein ZWY2020_046811 [Hordeum vulgare]